MKNFIKILIFSLLAITAYAQQSTEIDSKSVKLIRYAESSADTAGKANDFTFNVLVIKQ
jgi:hypothetical protein